MLTHLLFWTTTLFALITAAHILLHKRDPRGAIGWLGFVFFLPLAGSLAYWLIGVNRIKGRGGEFTARSDEEDLIPHVQPPDSFPFAFADGAYRQLLQVSDRVTRRPLLCDNRITPLYNGDQAYPAMLAAITAAKHSVYLSTYIFETNRTGRAFVDALQEAQSRGVHVAVIIDWLGELYSFPRIGRLLKKRNIPYVRFLAPGLHSQGAFINLRSHRKLLTIDGSVGFTGGMNIGDRHLLADSTKKRRPVIDIHFRVEGPIVRQMETVFREDWFFQTGKALPHRLTPLVPVQGGITCRGISSGPNEEFEKLHWLILSMINAATEHIRIMTPYFIPNRAILAALSSAALRGVVVDIILPANNNLIFVSWASRAHLPELLPCGVNVFFQPGAFVHSKLLLVDNSVSLIGSANIDNRSVFLNFEFTIEAYDPDLTRELIKHFEESKAGALPVRLEDMEKRSLAAQLRDAAMKLFSPYL